MVSNYNILKTEFLKTSLKQEMKVQKWIRDMMGEDIPIMNGRHTDEEQLGVVWIYINFQPI